VSATCLLNKGAGTLKSNYQQVVMTDPANPVEIVIQPAQPSTVYVPVYSPIVVYGAWPYATVHMCLLSSTDFPRNEVFVDS
jgi:Protein of unknown function (DUF3300)